VWFIIFLMNTKLGVKDCPYDNCNLLGKRIIPCAMLLERGFSCYKTTKDGHVKKEYIGQEPGEIKLK
jgi:hypothetical protein